MNIFNPEHDLCLANGSPHFVPPDSALEFGRNCSGLNHWIEENTDDRIIPWGWDPYLKRQLQKKGIPDTLLPTDSEIAAIRELSHRRISIQARRYIDIALGRYKHLLTTPSGVETTSIAAIDRILENWGSIVLKAPWSGSGKGLRWVRKGEFYPSDRGWCGRTIERQGSVLIEKRFPVIQDFALLFHLTRGKVCFAGYSLFYNDNGMYRGNLLASDGLIFRILGQWLAPELIEAVKNAVTSFIAEHIAGRYDGYLGVDMFVCQDDHSGGILLNPCVEINVRMTMGLLARKVYDRLEEKLGDGEYCVSVEYRPRFGEISQYIKDTDVLPLHDIGEENRYAVIIKPFSQS